MSKTVSCDFDGKQYEILYFVSSCYVIQMFCVCVCVCSGARARVCVGGERKGIITITLYAMNRLKETMRAFNALVTYSCKETAN